MQNSKVNQKYRKLFLILLFYLLVSLAMYSFYRRDFVWNGDDVYYHFQRMMGLSANFTDKILYSNISPVNFGKFGYGVNIFYPWLTLLPFKFAFMVAGDWINAFYLGLLFYFFVSLLISHYAMKKFSGSTRSAMFFAIIYNFSTYRLIEMFSRSSLAEYLATIFLPLCFLGFYELFFGDGKQWKPLAFGMSLIILSHVLTTFLTIIMFVLISLIFVKWIKWSKRLWLNLGKAVLMTVLATLIYTVPFLSEELFQKYGVPDRQILKGLDLWQLIKASYDNNALRLVEGNTYNIGLIILLALIAGIFLFRKFSRTYQAIYLVFLATFLLSTSLFPWHILQNTPIEVIQFPYRLLMFVTLFGAIVATRIVEIGLGTYPKQYFPILLFCVTFICGGLWTNSITNAAQGQLLQNPKTRITRKMIRDDKIPNSYLEQYVPKTGQAMLYTMTQHKINVNDKTYTQEPIENNHGNDFYLTDIKKGDVIDLPYVRYKYTKANFNGQSVPVQLSKRGSVQIIAPKDAAEVTIHMHYGNRKLFGLALVISTLAWIWLICSSMIVKIFGSFSKKS